jgi:myosin-crossreactive antigen
MRKYFSYLLVVVLVIFTSCMKDTVFTENVSVRQADEITFKVQGNLMIYQNLL